MFYAFLPLAVPVIGALQRYGVSRGYEGKTRQQAWEDAKLVFVFLGVIVVGIHVVTGW